MRQRKCQCRGFSEHVHFETFHIWPRMNGENWLQDDDDDDDDGDDDKDDTGPAKVARL
jgi:hypothetical protein